MKRNVLISVVVLVCLAVVIAIYEGRGDGGAGSDSISVAAFEHELLDARKAPGTAQVCLTDTDIHLPPSTAIVLPATAVFELDEPAVGAGETPKPQTAAERAYLVTLAPVGLSTAERCQNVPVKMMTGYGHDAGSAPASETRIYRLEDVVDYPVPERRPAVEIGQLIDDVSVKAILRTDVNASVHAPRVARDDAGKAQACRQGASDLAQRIGKSLGRQTEQVVFIDGVSGGEASYGCGVPPRYIPYFFASWEGQAHLSPSIRDMVAEAGADLTGVGPRVVSQQLEACVTDALRPDAGELAKEQFFGAKLDCQAYARDGGGGTVTVHRRFGSAK